jgi:spore maturation protein CgeB
MPTNPGITRCSICLSTVLSPAFICRGYQLAHCGDCGHLFVVDPIPEDVLEKAYDAGYYRTTDKIAEGIEATGYSDYLANAETRQQLFRERFSTVSRFTAGPGKLLDYGCAIGLFVKVAAEAGWNARGYERSSWAADYGRSQFGLDITVADGRLDPFGANSFNVVTLWDVLEHLQHPRRVLDLLSKWLIPGGLLALNTVNRSSLGARMAGPKWRHLAPPHHLQFYSRRSLARLLAEFGFRTLWRRSEGVLFAGMSTEVDSGHARPRLECLAQYWRLRPLVTTLNLLDEIAVIAVKA